MKRLALLAAVFFACGSPQTTTQAEDPPPDSRKQAIERLDARQRQACQRMCPRLTECALEDAKANVSPADLKDGPSLEEIAPSHTAQCNSECNRTRLSLRQIRVYEGCMDKKQLDCGALVVCLEQAQSKKSSR